MCFQKFPFCCRLCFQDNTTNKSERVDIFSQSAIIFFPNWIKLSSRNTGTRPHTARDVNILLLRTWTTHYTHSFPLKRLCGGRLVLRGEGKCCHWLKTNLSHFPHLYVCLCILFQAPIQSLVLLQEVHLLCRSDLCQTFRCLTNSLGDSCQIKNNNLMFSTAVTLRCKPLGSQCVFQ